LLVVPRRGASWRLPPGFIDELNRKLTPDNIVGNPPEVREHAGVTAAIFNPTGATRSEGVSIALGAFFESMPSWHEPGTAVPDGTYALLRCNDDSVELVADPAASRTIWYALTEEAFIASTSQRAIVTLLGDFRMNRQALLWMLSSGTLGPDGGWDTRIERVRPAQCVTLDRRHWRLSATTAPGEFVPNRGLTETQQFERISGALREACGKWSFDPAKWVLPLSGGVDSRGLLLLLRDRGAIKTVTWGTHAARKDPGNDAVVAPQVAAALGVSNRFCPTELSSEPPEQLFERFLVAGEGRVARISGYLDGFRIWKTLCEDGVDGVIRGDEAFGAEPVPNHYNARFRGSLTLLSDYFGADEIDAYELRGQVLPDQLGLRPNESLATWRDRSYLAFRVPALLAALTDLKSPYVEVVNPLLARPVLECVRTLPDNLRTDKRLWRRLVESLGPNVPFATQPAIVQLQSVVSDPSVVRLMSDEMGTRSAEELFAAPLRMSIRAGLRKSLDRGEGSPRPRLRDGLPIRLRMKIRGWLGVKPELSPTLLAFRAFIASRMNAILKEDARTLHASAVRTA
jgi:hypothetical protein